MLDIKELTMEFKNNIVYSCLVILIKKYLYNISMLKKVWFTQFFFGYVKFDIH